MEGFVEIYDEHIWDVYGFLSYRLASREEVEDLVQQTFERALRAWSRFDPGRASARTWLLAIARNLMIDHSGAARGPPRSRCGRARPATPSSDFVEPPDSGLGLDPELEAGARANSESASAS